MATLVFGAPLILLAWLRIRGQRWTVRQVAQRVAFLAVVLLLMTATAWYVDPDFAGSPRASVAGTLLMLAPSLAATAALGMRGRTHPWPARVLAPLLAGYVVLLASAVPAMLLFVALGGDTL